VRACAASSRANVAFLSTGTFSDFNLAAEKEKENIIELV
jgi:hypothetical protein